MNDELDPDIAGRFAALDDVQPPDTWPGIATSGGASDRAAVEACSAPRPHW